VEKNECKNMNTSRQRIESIFHPSDFSEASEIAFLHALKIALVTKAELTMLHVDPGNAADWGDFPGVRSTLERWGLIPGGSAKSAVGNLGIKVQKIIASSRSPVRACLDFVDKHPPDLIVLAVHQYEGRVRWQHKRVAEPIAHATAAMTLYVPHGVPGFVAHETGAVSLNKILIPIARKPRAQPALDAVGRLIRGLELTQGKAYLLHVGSGEDVPPLQVPAEPGWDWAVHALEGDAAEVIVQTAAAAGSDLIVMTTEGPHGFLDALRGSTAERVLRECRCPVLTLHA
jgi:nucleotide-binding universal stress UspA family protein